MNTSVDLAPTSSWRETAFWKHVWPRHPPRRADPLAKIAARWARTTRIELMFVVIEIVSAEASSSGLVRTRLANRRMRAVSAYRQRFGDDGFTQQWLSKRLPWEVK